MAKLSAAILVAVFMVALGVNGEVKARNKRDTIQIVSNVNVLDWLCQNNPWGLYFSWCSTTTASPQTSTVPNSGSASSSASSTSAPASTSSTTPPTPLQSATWCQFSNGTFLTLGQTFMQMACIMCQCAQSHDIACTTLPCMPTSCIDGSTPTVQPGSCCATCAYETQAASCTQGGITFPQGTIIKTQANNVQCWCQSGTIECRTSVTTVTTSQSTSWDYYGNGTTTYIIVIVICLVLMLSTLLCCGCAVLYYYYYYNQQQSMQQAYEQYYNNAGWQPMGEEGQFSDGNAKDKELESEQSQFENQHSTGFSPEFIPPPYAVYNGPYGAKAEEKVQRQV